MLRMFFAVGLLLYCIVACSKNSYAREPYIAAKLFDMAATADEIVYGTIIREQGRYMDVRPANRSNVRVLKVEKQEPRNSGRRKQGQQVFLFLKKKGDVYTIMSEGGEGELAIIKDSVVLSLNCFTPATNQLLAGPRGITPEYKARHTFIAGNDSIFGMRFHLKYFYKSVMDFRDCYQVILKKGSIQASSDCFNFFERYPKSKSDVLKKKSALLRLMYRDMESAQVHNCR